jgi:TnpA family transposase
MPRRRALTEAQLQTLFALPTTEADLIRHWTLSSDDLAAIGRRRRDHNRLGFALQLCALRFVADQLGTDPEALTAYAARFQTW